MPVDDKDFYHMQAHMHYQDEKLEGINRDIAAMQVKLDILIEHMHQSKGSARTLAFFSGLIGAIIAGATEYIIYYVLQK